MVHDLGMHRENALDAVAEAHLANRNALAHARAIAGDHRAFEGLEALFVAFLDLHVNLDGVTGPEYGNGLFPLILVNKLRQQRVLHGNVRKLLVYNRIPARAVGEASVMPGAAPESRPWRAAPLPPPCSTPVPERPRSCRHTPTTRRRTELRCSPPDCR